MDDERKDAGTQRREDGIGTMEVCEWPGLLGYYRAQAEELARIVDKLPQTADGVPVVPGMQVWFWCQCAYGYGLMPDRVVGFRIWGLSTDILLAEFGEERASHCWSTLEAASASRRWKSDD